MPGDEDTKADSLTTDAEARPDDGQLEPEKPESYIYRAIIDATRDAIIMVDDEGVINLWNNAAEKLFGWLKAEAEGKSVHELIAPESFHQDAMTGMAGFKANGKGSVIGKTLELEAIHKNGHKFPMELSLSSIKIAEKFGAVGIVRDISERKRTEGILSASNERYKALFESSRDSLMTIEPPSWVFTSGNPATCKMFGAKDETEFTSHAPWELSPQQQPDGRLSAEKAKEMIETAIREGSHFFEWTHKRVNGEEFPATVLLTRLEIDGEVLVQATVRDITGQKVAENALKKWAEIFKNAEWGIVVSEGKDKRIGLMNPAFARMLGYTVEELAGRSGLDVFPPESREDSLKQVKIAYEKGHHVFESINLRKDGSEFPVHIDISVVKNENGEPSYQIVNVVDITERKRAEAVLREAERLGAIGEIAAGVAHDFNNALTHIIGGIELAILDGALSPETNADLASAKQAAFDVAARVKQLQRFAGTTRESFEYEVVDINSAVKDAVAQTRGLWKDEAQEHGLGFTVQSNCPDNLTVSGNSGELRSALFNLIKNGIEAMPEGGTITIDAVRKDNEVSITVADTGVGMDEATKLRIFQPFFSTKGFEQGRGLGLSGVHSIVREHKGVIEVIKTTHGKGTTIEIRLPYAEKKPVLKKEDGVECLGTARVLWVDDEEGIRKAGKRMLGKLGHQTDLASCGQDALTLLETNQYDLLITDKSMPGMSGYQLIEKIKGKYPKMKIVVLTGHDNTISAEERHERGIGCIIGKPFDQKMIENMIREMMQMK